MEKVSLVAISCGKKHPTARNILRGGSGIFARANIKFVGSDDPRNSWNARENIPAWLRPERDRCLSHGFRFTPSNSSIDSYRIRVSFQPLVFRDLVAVVPPVYSLTSSIIRWNSSVSFYEVVSACVIVPKN